MEQVEVLKSRRARDVVLDWVKTGRLVPGQQIPPERLLSKELNMTQKTLRRGLAQLVKEGVIVKQPRVGNFVRDITSTTRIAIVLPEHMLHSTPQHPAAPLFINGISQVLDQRDYVVSALAYGPSRCWLDAGQVAAARDIQGLILCPQINVTREELRQFICSGMKIVLLGYHPCAPELGLVTVDIDTNMALAQIMEKLIELGHRRICVVKYADSPVRELEERMLQGFCQRIGMTCLSDLILNVPNHQSSGQIDYQYLERLFDDGPRPTAVVAADEFLVSELFRLCYSRGLNVPKDISIAARWDSLSHVYPVPLTAPDSAKLARQAGEIAAELLIKLLSGRPAIEREIHLRCDVEWHESTGPVPQK